MSAILYPIAANAEAALAAPTGRAARGGDAVGIDAKLGSVSADPADGGFRVGNGVGNL